MKGRICFEAEAGDVVEVMRQGNELVPVRHEDLKEMRELAGKYETLRQLLGRDPLETYQKRKWREV